MSTICLIKSMVAYKTLSIHDIFDRGVSVRACQTAIWPGQVPVNKMPK